jgi:hypothetical protein
MIAMNPLQSRLAALRRRLRLFITFRGVCWLTATILCGAVIGGLLDWTVHLPSLVRALVLVVTVSGAIYAAIRYLVGPLAARADDLTLALKVEEHYPELNDALASTVQFLQQNKESEIHDSTSLRREAVQRAMRVAQGCDFNKVVNPRGTRAATAVMAVAGAAAVTCVLLAPLVSFTAVLRLFDPFGEHDWPRQTQIVLDYPSLIGVGQPLVIRGELKGKIPDEAVFEFEGHSPTVRNVPVKANEDKTGKLSVALDMTRQRTSLRFRVKANDATSPARERAWHEVKVLPPPRLDLLDGKPSPQVELFFRPYTDLQSPLALSPGKGDIEAFAGTRVRLRAATDKPITQAWVEFRPSGAQVTTATVLAPLGATHPVHVWALSLGGRQVWDVVPGTIEPSGRVLTVDFLPWVQGDYALHIRDSQGLGNSSVYRLDVNPDPPPVVTLRQPSGSQSVTSDAEISLALSVEDPFFGIRRAYLEYRLKDANGNFLDAGPRRLPLFDHEQMGWTLPPLMSGLAGMPLSIPGPPLRMRPKALEIERRWSLFKLAEEGQTLVLQACAEDFNDVPAFPQPGRSTVVELRIVPRSVIAAELADRQAQIQKDLVKLRDAQNDAHKKLLEVKQQWEGKARLSPEERQKLEQVVQAQKQIQNNLGAEKDEGLRLKLEEVQQILKDNKMPSSGDKDRINAIRNEVDRLSENHVPKILEELKNSPPKKDAVKSPADPAAKRFEGHLAKATEHQAEVSKSLDDLLKYLDPWSSTHDVKAEAKAILKEQKDLLNDTKQLAQKEMPPEEEKAALGAKAALQRRLAERTQRLLDKTLKLADEREEKDPDSAKTLRDAADFPEKNEFLPGEMREAEKFIREKQLNRAVNEQTNSVKSLEEMVKALDEKREEDLDRLVKKQKQLQKELKQLTDDMERLQKKSRDAAKIADPKERQRQLKKLAEKQKELQEEAQKKVRELARLQAGDAAKSLEEAGEKMARAARELDRGESPEEEQKEALERLDDAREELEQTRKDTEEELAREQLEKIVDHLKGLKERQDALTQDVAALHRRLLREGQWDKGLKTSLSQYQNAQDGLGQETAELRKKLEKAPVFAHILQRTADAMDQAAQVMKSRHKEAKEEYEEQLKAWKKTHPVQEQPVLPSQFKKQKRDQSTSQLPQSFPLNEQGQAREKRYEEKTQKLQKDASNRLARLIDAMKNDKGGLVQRQKPKEGEENGGGKKDGDGQNAGGRRGDGDGIPQLAELKALRAEQADVNDRTKEFAQQHPDLNNLADDARVELQALQTDQQRVHELFQKVSAAEPKGGNP